VFDRGVLTDASFQLKGLTMVLRGQRMSGLSLRRTMTPSVVIMVNTSFVGE
jgi:hypothetical protein